MRKRSKPAIEIVNRRLEKFPLDFHPPLLLGSYIHPPIHPFNQNLIGKIFQILDQNLTERAARGMHSSNTVASTGLPYFISAGSVLLIRLYVKPRTSICNLLTRGKMLVGMGHLRLPYGR